MKYWNSIFFVLFLFSCTSHDRVFIAEDRLPLTEQMFYQENTVERSVARLLDGDLKVNFDPGARLLKTVPHPIGCNFPESRHDVHTRIRGFDGGSGEPINEPTKYFLVRKPDGAEIEVGTVDGNLYK